VHTYGVSAGIWIWIFGGTVLYVLEILDQDSEQIQGRQAPFKFVNDGFRVWTVEWATTSQLEGNQRTVPTVLLTVGPSAGMLSPYEGKPCPHATLCPGPLKGENALVPGHWQLEL
jgi:hypothetical protein